MLYFSIVQRKALTPNEFGSLDALAERLLGFADHYRQITRPFEWDIHPQRTSTGSSPESTPTNPNSTSPHDHRTCGRMY
jgi:hypothetical protein